MKKTLWISLLSSVLLMTAAAAGTAGYSGVSLAKIAEKKTVIIDPADYGAVADDDNDDGAGLQKALDAAKAKAEPCFWPRASIF